MTQMMSAVPATTTRQVLSPLWFRCFDDSVWCRRQRLTRQVLSPLWFRCFDDSVWCRRQRRKSVSSVVSGCFMMTRHGGADRRRMSCLLPVFVVSWLTHRGAHCRAAGWLTHVVPTTVPPATSHGMSCLPVCSFIVSWLTQRGADYRATGNQPRHVSLVSSVVSSFLDWRNVVPITVPRRHVLSP